jgi:hypothetical protein
MFMFIYDDYYSSYENLLEKSKLPSLKIRWLKTIAVETFKIIHKNSSSYLHELINIKLQNNNIRSQETAVLPRVRTTRYGLKSFRYNAAQIWNELPNHCRRETRGGSRGGAPPKIEKNMIFWRKIVIFHTNYPKNFRASLRNWKKIWFFGIKS